MPLTVTCPQCSKPLTYPDEFIGRQVQCLHCQSMVLAEDKQRLGNYTVVRKLGEGGMGAVYEGIQDGLNRKVALKLLPQRLLKDPTYLERFQREAQGAAALNHPNIVTVYEIGQDRGHYFFSMEFVDGASLGNRISKEKRLPVSDALDITRKVASALDYAWREAGLVHRDIKPDNIMLTSQGHIKVADLGLAKRITTDSNLTNEGAGLGTPHYMAPEQSQGARDVDCRADIYSLGITLYEMLTGKVPYDGATPYAVIIAHLESPLPDPRESCPEISDPLWELIRTMCAKEPDDRYQSHAEVIDAIDNLADPSTAVIGRRNAPTEPAPLLGLEEKTGDPSSSEVGLRGRSTVGELRPARDRRPLKIYAAIGFVCLTIISVSAMLLFRGEKKPARQRKPRKFVAVNPVADLFQKALRFTREHPNEFEAAIGKFGLVQRSGPRTKFFRLAADEIRKLEERLKASGRFNLGARLKVLERARPSVFTDKALEDFKVLYLDQANEAGTKEAVAALGAEMLAAAADLKNGLRYLVHDGASRAALFAEDGPAAVSSLSSLYPLDTPFRKTYLKELLPQEAALFKELKGVKLRDEVNKDKKLRKLCESVIEHTTELCRWSVDDLEFDEALEAIQLGVLAASTISSEETLRLRRYGAFAKTAKKMAAEAEQLAEAQPAETAWTYLEAGDPIAAGKLNVKSPLIRSTIAYQTERSSQGIFAAAEKLEERAADAEGVLKQIRLIRAADLYEGLMSRPDSDERKQARERLRAISKELGEYVSAMRYPRLWLDLVKMPRTRSKVGYGNLGVITRERGPFNLAGHRPRWGFLVHAKSVLAFNLRGRFRIFQTGFALQDRGGGAARMLIACDGENVYTGRYMWRGHGWGMATPQVIDVTGVDSLELIVEYHRHPAGSFAAWGEPKIR